jgi:hypothetical protein
MVLRNTLYARIIIVLFLVLNPPPLDSISTHEEFFLLLEIVIRLLKDKAPIKIQIGEIVDENMVD